VSLAKIVDQDIKHIIAKRFGDAAHKYDKHALVQQEVADSLLAWSSFGCANISKGGVAADIGCGTGYLSHQVSRHFDQWLNVDIAKGMLQAGKNLADVRLFSPESMPRPSLANQSFIVGDAEQLPLKDESIDVMLSSMALQWCRNPQTLMEKLHGALVPQGKAILAIMVSPSFTSLSQAWKSLGIAPRVNTFATSAQWLDAAKSCKWQVNSHQACFFTEHENVSAMLKSIKTVGANALIDKSSRKAFSKTELMSLDAYFEAQLSHTLDYQVLFLECQKQA
jgi:malonyl-CoA O-methyltransferase